MHQGQQQMVDPDAIQEVRVIDADAGAQYAAPATAILSTKSGTNALHGTLFGRPATTALESPVAEMIPADYEAPQYIRNEFGASIGGPILIPHLYNGKEQIVLLLRLRAIFAGEAPAENQSRTHTGRCAGRFQPATNSSNVLQTLYDPATTAAAGLPGAYIRRHRCTC